MNYRLVGNELFLNEIYRPDLKFTDEQYNFTDEHQNLGGVSHPPHPPVGSPLVVMLELLNYSFHIGELPPSMREGVITLIPKKDKSPLYLKNWRPISLLNTDHMGDYFY